jgi:hypothetical protein
MGESSSDNFKAAVIQKICAEPSTWVVFEILLAPSFNRMTTRTSMRPWRRMMMLKQGCTKMVSKAQLASQSFVN